MSLFPRNLYGGDASFTPLFRLLDDFDNYRTEVQGSNGPGRKGGRALSARTFVPKFDVREREDAYELHGELPGVDRENINIEFTEPQTLVISGHIERTYQSGTPPEGYLEGTKMSGAITEGGEQKQTKAQKATVEDEGGEKAKEQGKEQGKEQHKEHHKEHHKQQQDEHAQQQQQAREKYWVMERSVGEFSRTFSFPTRVDQEGVTASLNNGVLTVTVPKAKKHESRRIAIK